MYYKKQFLKQNTLGQLDKYISNRYYNAQKSNRKKTITITTQLLVYGTAASQQVAIAIAKNIQNHWNAPKAIATIDGVHYKVVFKIKGQCYQSLQPNWINNNLDQKLFFIRVEQDVAHLGVSLMDGVCSNTGFFKISNVAYKGASTEAHEYGHALGLWPGTNDGHPTDLDQRGKGKPGIMYPRGSWVDAQYQYYPNVQPGEVGGTVNPDKRHVRQLDIDMLQLDKRNWSNKGKIRLGKLSNKYHEEQFEF
jgi:hypothetical protein